MALAPEDRLAISESVSLHGHLVDDGSLERLEELFTADVVHDLTDFGQGCLVGVAAVREALWPWDPPIPLRITSPTSSRACVPAGVGATG
ncbi:nuclear transport factor 2 family protein [Streptomyces sp. NPDC002403]